MAFIIKTGPRENSDDESNHLLDIYIEVHAYSWSTMARFHRLLGPKEISELCPALAKKPASIIQWLKKPRGCFATWDVLTIYFGTVTRGRCLFSIEVCAQLAIDMDHITKKISDLDEKVDELHESLGCEVLYPHNMANW